MRSCNIVICITALALFSSTARAGLIINFAQVGNDVVATGSGSANVSNLNFLLSVPNAQVNVEASTGNYRGGVPGGQFVVYSGLTIPPTGYGTSNAGFGPGTGTNNTPNSTTGDYFGLTGFNGRLFLPDGYVSGTQLSNTATWNNQTLTNLGLAPLGSTFTYSWGSGANADSITINVTAVPEPSSLLCLTLGLSCVALFRRTRLPRLHVG